MNDSYIDFIQTVQNQLESGGYVRRRKRWRNRKTNKTKRFFRSWLWEVQETNTKRLKMEQQSASDMFYGASDVRDYITGGIIFERNKRELETHHKEVTIISDKNDWLAYLMMTELRAIQVKSDNGLMLDDNQLSYLDYDISSSSVVVKLYGHATFVNLMYIEIVDKFEEVKNVIEWVYNPDGSSIEIPVRGDREPVEEMYPFLKGESLADYYDRFMHSSASILLLIGPPGTGKTTFIRGLLQHAEISAIVTYDTAILSKDYLFAQFIEGNRNVLIVEDADNFLGARTDGNDFMHKFLNVGDGLVTTKNKKMIFSTNLPSVKDIDPALIRPGRCFDILNFETLTQDQAVALANKVDVQLDGVKDKWSIADIFHKQTEAPKAPRRRLGFI